MHSEMFHPDRAIFPRARRSLMSAGERIGAASLGAPPDPITTNEFKTMIAASDDQDVKEVSTIVFCTAIRTDELLKLSWDDIDFNTHVILIRDGGGIHRRVPFANTTEDILRARKQREPLAQWVLGKSPQSVLLAVSQNLMVLSQRVLNRPVTLHSIRLGFLGWWKSVAGNLGQLALIAGLPVQWNNPSKSKDHLFAAAAKVQAWRETFV